MLHISTSNKPIRKRVLYIHGQKKVEISIFSIKVSERAKGETICHFRDKIRKDESFCDFEPL